MKPTPEQVADALETWCQCNTIGEICQHHLVCSYQAHGAKMIREQAAEIERLKKALK